MADQAKLNALTSASIKANMEVTRLIGKVSKLRAIYIKLKNQSTTIKYIVTLSESIAGDKYDDEENQEKADLTSLEKILVTKKEEILGLLDVKIKQVEAELASAQTVASNARNALIAAMNSWGRWEDDSKSKKYFGLRKLCK